MSVLIVIPVLDEAWSIGRVVTAARAHGPVLVVDDGSRDGSGEAAAAAGAEVLRHPRPLGKAQALLTGVAAARRRGAARIVTLDGDGQHDPVAIPLLLAAAEAAGRAIVLGNRLDGRGALPALRRNAVRVASFFAGWTCGRPVADSQSGFRVYPLALFDEVRPRRGGFVFETEVLLKAAARGWAIVEVGVPALPRAAAQSHFRPLRDGVAIGAFLSGRVLARWADEARAVGAELLGVFDGTRMARRHAAMLEAAAGYSDSPARWSMAVGAIAVRRAGARLGAVWAGVRQRGAPAAALATLVTPVALPLLVAQALVGERLPDFATPLVDAVYGRRRGAPSREPVDVTAAPVAEGRG
ncbi:MAG TPA: glycosyltransferase family 2 protein [Candidatus Binatia bacterium]|nr:glycosyltransferase family 2 protein [Candidatus Binatia bacterium]